MVWVHLLCFVVFPFNQISCLYSCPTYTVFDPFHYSVGRDYCIAWFKWLQAKYYLILWRIKSCVGYRVFTEAYCKQPFGFCSPVTSAALAALHKCAVQAGCRLFPHIKFHFLVFKCKVGENEERGGAAGFVAMIEAIRWRWRGSTVPLRELNEVPVWSGTEAAAEHSTSPGGGLSPKNSAALTFIDTPLYSWPERLSQLCTARNYARGRRTCGAACSGKPRTKEGTKPGVQQLTWVERSSVEGERVESGVGSDFSVFSFFRNVTWNVQDFRDEARQFGKRGWKRTKSWVVSGNDLQISIQILGAWGELDVSVWDMELVLFCCHEVIILMLEKGTLFWLVETFSARLFGSGYF